MSGKFSDTFFRLGASGFAAYGSSVYSNTALRDSRVLWKGLVEQRQTLGELQLNPTFGDLYVDYGKTGRNARLLRPLCPPLNATVVNVKYWSMSGTTGGSPGRYPSGAASFNNGPKWGSAVETGRCDADVLTPTEFGLMRGAPDHPIPGNLEFSFDIYAACLAGKCLDACTIETFIAYNPHYDKLTSPLALPFGIAAEILNKTAAVFTGGPGETIGKDMYYVIPEDFYKNHLIPMGPLPMPEVEGCPSILACVVTITHEGADTPDNPGSDKVIGIDMKCN